MNKKRITIMVIVMALLAVPLAAAATHDGPLSKEMVSGGWSCPDGQKIDTGEAGTYDVYFGNFSGSVEITVNSDKTVTFRTDHNWHRVTSVLVKGGPQALLWHWENPGVRQATVHAPVNDRNGKYYGVSHLCFMTEKKNPNA